MKLNKLRPKFRAVGGPESFIQGVRASGTLDLHRVPLTSGFRGELRELDRLHEKSAFELGE